MNQPSKNKKMTPKTAAIPIPKNTPIDSPEARFGVWLGILISVGKEGVGPGVVSSILDVTMPEDVKSS